jgi:hypothetical protein
VDGRALPQYFVMLGGTVDEGGARFARIAAKIPVRRIPAAVERLLGLYAAERREGESATAFFARVDLARAKDLLADLAAVPPGGAASGEFVDLAESAPFRIQTKEGECAA